MTATNFPAQYARTRRFTTGTPRTFTVANDGSEVLFLRSKAESDPILCLWSINTSTGAERLVVDPAALDIGNQAIPPAELARRERARESANGIVGYNLSADSTRACFALGGSLVVADISSGATAMPPVNGSVFDPRFSPDGTSVGYVSDGTFRIINLDTDIDSLVAGDDSATVTWGAAEFVAAEEMGRSRGFWWAPDSESVLVAKVDTSPVDVWWIADPAHPHNKPNEIRYPAAGTNNAIVELWHYPIGRAETSKKVDWSGGTYEYLANVLWPKNADVALGNTGPLVVRQTRDQRTTSIAAIDLSTGAVTDRRLVTNEVWVELIPGSPTLHELGLLTVEDIAATDVRALCLEGTPVSSEEIQVRAILGTNNNTVTFTASPVPTEIHLYTLDLETGTQTQLTTTPGVHGGTTSGETLVVSSASPEVAGSTVTVTTSGNSGDTGTSHPVTSYASTPSIAADPSFFEFGERKLSTAVFLPSDHDGQTPLPVLLDPYGGPHAQRVMKTHNSHLVSRWFAEQGFAVLVTDGRGTPGRGPAFEREVFGDLAAPILEDQLDALDGAAAHFGFLDLQRVGIRGWSFGGYLAALGVLRAPDRIHAAIAGAPVTTWNLYDTHYTERYLGHPETHPDHYSQSDLIIEADKLDRPLLLIHGLADDNVVAAHTLQFSTALLIAGKAHQVLPLSGVTHMTPQIAVAENLLRLQLTFLKEHLA